MLVALLTLETGVTFETTRGYLLCDLVSEWCVMSSGKVVFMVRSVTPKW